jgi:DNA primase
VAGEREGLKAALQMPGYCGPAFDSMDPAFFTFPAHRAVFTAIREVGGTQAAPGGAGWVTQVSEACADDDARHLVRALAVEPLRYAGEDERGYVAEVVSRLREFDLTRRIATLKAQMQRMNPLEAEGYNKIFGELMGLEALKRQLRGGGSA